MKWLLDTCVLSEFVKPVPEPRVVDWLRKQPNTESAISVLTIAEIEKGIQRLPESAKKTRLHIWLTTDVIRRFEDRILNVDLAIAQQWASLQAHMELKGLPLAAIDALIVATAQVHHMTLVTRDDVSMKATGVPLFNPWSA